MMGCEAITVSERMLRVNVSNPFKTVDFLNEKSSVKTNTAFKQAKPIVRLDHFNRNCSSFTPTDAQCRNTSFQIILFKGM